jgi:hypothetical protein
MYYRYNYCHYEANANMLEIGGIYAQSLLPELLLTIFQHLELVELWSTALACKG